MFHPVFFLQNKEPFYCLEHDEMNYRNVYFIMFLHWNITNNHWNKTFGKSQESYKNCKIETKL